MRMTATTSIHTHSERWTPAHVPMMEPKSWAMSTINTQPPPYRVKVMQIMERMLGKRRVKGGKWLTGVAELPSKLSTSLFSDGRVGVPDDAAELRVALL